MKKAMHGGVVRSQASDLEERLAVLFGEKYRKYREAWSMAGPNYIPSFPLHVDFELADECNMACVFCPRNTKMHPNLPYTINTRKRLSDSLLEKFLKEAEKFSLPSINLSIGEPLLDDRCFSFVKQFHAIGGVDSRVITNGLLVDKVVDQIFDSGLVHLFVSLDAFSEETYRPSRLGPKGRYQKIVDNILLISKEKERRKSLLPIMRVSFIELEINQHEKDDFLAFWQGKVDFVDIQLRRHFGNLVGGQKPKKFNCIDPFRRMAIAANRDILPCCNFYGKTLVVGNFDTMSLEETWKGEKMADVREALLKDKSSVCLACQEC